MSLTFPLTPPTTPGFRSIQWLDQGNVGVAMSPFTAQQQVTEWPHQLWTPQVTLPPMRDAVAGPWIAFFLSLNGQAGTFFLGDSVRKTQLGSMSGSVTVAAGAVANSTTLPFSGTGTPVVGDWWQVFTGSSARLHRIVKVNAGSVDVFPKLRSAYASGTAITYNNAKGVFRLAARVPAMFNETLFATGITFQAMEAL